MINIVDGWRGERQVGKIITEIEPKHVARYQCALKYCNEANVLDAACGCGYGSNLISFVAKNVLGVDNSADAIKYANDHWNAPNVKFQEYDLNGSFDDLGVFDTIISLETLEHLIPEPIVTLEKFDAKLKPSGFLIYSHPELESILSGGKFHMHFNIKGDIIIEWMDQYNYKLVYDWIQPGRFAFNYRVVVLQKVKL